MSWQKWFCRSLRFVILKMSMRLITRLFLLSIAFLSVTWFTPHAVAAACASLPTGSGTATFALTVPSSGVYRLWVHEYSPSANNNGVYAQIGNYCQITVGDSAAIPVGQFIWIDYQNATPSNVMDLNLTAGNQMMTLAGLDQGVGVDKVLLVSDLHCVPVGQGDNCNATTTVTPPSPPVTGGTTGVIISPIASGNITLPQSNGQRRTYFLDGKPVVGTKLDTSVLSDGKHTLQVVEKGPDGQTKILTQTIVVSNHLGLAARLDRLVRRPLVWTIASIVALSVAAVASVWFLKPAWIHWAVGRLRFLRTPKLPLVRQAVVYGENDNRPRRYRWKAILFSLVFAAIGVGTLLYSFAGTITVSYVLSDATLANGATVVVNAAAVGGKMVQFQPPAAPAPPPSPPPSPSPSPSPGSGVGTATCPAYPAFPDENCTGYLHTGVTLHACSTTLTSNTTYDSCKFTGVISMGSVSNVTITRSLVVGRIEYSINGSLNNLHLTDVEIDGNKIADGQSAIGNNDYTCVRCNIHGTNRGANVGFNVTIQDSYLHGWWPGNPANDHVTGVGSNGGANNTITHNSITCEILNDPTEYACSSGMSVYGDDAPGNNNWTITNNLINAGSSSCMIIAGPPAKPYPFTNMHVTGNHFGNEFEAYWNTNDPSHNPHTCSQYGPIDTQPSSWGVNGNVWSGNVHSNGATVDPS